MIKKLIKYDVIKMMGVLPYFYAFAIFFAGLTRLVNIWSDIQFIFIIGQIFQGTTIALMVNILVNSFLGVIVRSLVPSFYKDESYLTHTLPVTKNELMLSKFVSAIIITFLSFIVCFACLFIMFYSQETMAMLKMLIEGIVVGFDMSAGTFVTIIALVLLFEIIATSKSFRKPLNHSIVSGKNVADLDTITVLSKSNIKHLMPLCFNSSKFISYTFFKL